MQPQRGHLVSQGLVSRKELNKPMSMDLVRSLQMESRGFLELPLLLKGPGLVLKDLASFFPAQFVLRALRQYGPPPPLIPAPSCCPSHLSS